jgi:hypothetical protein
MRSSAPLCGRVLRRKELRLKFLHRYAWLLPTLGLAGLTAGALATGGARLAPKAHPKVKAVAAPAGVTYAHDIAPILYQNCTVCHRTGEVAPFTLASYADARKRARQIALVTQGRVMPPWKADSHGEFQDERRLTDGQIALLQRWAEAGAPEGKPKQEPPVPHFPAGWALGQPDMIVTPPRPYTVEAEGRDVYRCYVIPTDFAEDRYVSAVDVHPGNRAVVHHALVYVDTGGTARRLEAKSQDGSPGYQEFGGIGFLPAGMLGGWAPGAMARRLPADTGILLPKGADIVLEVHYHKDGKPETDHTQVAVYFNGGTVARPMHIFPLANTHLRIPPGDKDYTLRASLPVIFDATLLTVFPHMHVLGRRMTVTATLPGGATKTLVDVPDWDFNWQGFYAYKQPVRLPAGSRVDLVAHYDNSPDNPLNPSRPPKLVTWGEQTTDEMCLCYLGFTVDAEHAPPIKTAGGLPK